MMSLQSLVRNGCSSTTHVRLAKTIAKLGPISAEVGRQHPFWKQNGQGSVARRVATLSRASCIGTASRQTSSRALSRVPASSPFHSYPAGFQCAHTAAKRQVLYSTKAAVTVDPIVHDVFEPKTGTWQYVVADPSKLAAVILDPVLDYDSSTNTITTETADLLLSLVKKMGYTVEMILETHAHADHLTAASYLQNRLGMLQDHKPPIGIGKRISRVQELFGSRYGVPKEEYENVFDKLFDDDESFKIGELVVTAMHLPGHTPDHMGYKIGDNVFCGDLLFHVDIGTARCDFPGGSATDLYQSTRKVLGLPNHVKIWTGHDYPPDGRADPVSWLSVQEHRNHNSYVKDGITQEDFVVMRHKRDEKLAEPKLLHQSLQMNIRAGRLPKPTESGQRLLHIPLKLRVTW